jgi:alkylhydroperoxidase/carboxymuconolactone decarboxylase family protein YurZ
MPYGEVWGHTDGLPLRMRSFLPIATPQIMRGADQLQFHVNNALNEGITRGKIQEGLMQTDLDGRLANKSWRSRT